MYLELQYKHQILTETNRSEVGCAGRSLQKKEKFALNKRTVCQKASIEAKFLFPSFLPVPSCHDTSHCKLVSIWTVSSWRQKLSCNLHLLCAAQEVFLPLLDPQVMFGRQLQLKLGSSMSLQLNCRACTVILEGHSALAPVKLHQLVSNHQE